MTSAIDPANQAEYEGLSFSEYHQREMSRQAALLTHAAGGKIKIGKRHYQELPMLKIVMTTDHATGDLIFSTDPDIQSFDASFEASK